VPGFFVWPQTSVSAWLHFSSVRRTGFDLPSRRSARDRISCSRSLLFSVSIRTRTAERAARADSAETEVSAARGQFSACEIFCPLIFPHAARLIIRCSQCLTKIWFSCVFGSSSVVFSLALSPAVRVLWLLLFIDFDFSRLDVVSCRWMSVLFLSHRIKRLEFL
jgi:hypothetical protein